MCDYSLTTSNRAPQKLVKANNTQLWYGHARLLRPGRFERGGLSIAGD